MIGRPAFSILVLLLISFSPLVAQERTGPSRLNDDEAQILLYVIPAAVQARQAGTDVDIERSQPTKNFPADKFFVAAVISQKPTHESVLGNGILGYFAVDRRSAGVESLADFSPVTGKELERVQAWLRHSHRIDKVTSRERKD